MQWEDEGIVVGARRHGEASAVVEVMTRARGRHLGLVRGGNGLKLKPILQIGNAVRAVWRARLDEHLGTYTIELLEARAAAALGSASALHALMVLASHARLLPEREPHPELYAGLDRVLAHVQQTGLCAALLVRFEVALLGALGFGLDLTACAVTGQRGDLSHVSPRTGRAVSAQAAQPYCDRLLALPDFLKEGTCEEPPTPQEIAEGFRLTGYFLDRHVWSPRRLEEPVSRSAMLAALTTAGDNRPARLVAAAGQG